MIGFEALSLSLSREGGVWYERARARMRARLQDDTHGAREDDALYIR